MLELEKAKRPGEIAVGVFPQMSNFGLLAAGPPTKCREVPQGKPSPPPKMFAFLSGKSLNRRRPMCGRPDTPTAPLNPPPKIAATKVPTLEIEEMHGFMQCLGENFS